MKTDTIATLRAKAKKLGLTGYSKLRKDELVKLIASKKTRTVAKPAATSCKTTPRTVALPKKSHRKQAKPVNKASAKVPAAKRMTSVLPVIAEAEQRIESTKYAFALPGVPEPQYAANLDEDIDRLPVTHEPLLCLLPQKPGVLHGYWMLPPALLHPGQSVRLRLVTLRDDRETLLAEHPVHSERGHHYFMVGESTGLDSVTLQLGSYQPGGKFISLIQRGIARLPSLYPSTQTDRLWWISDAQFKAMVQRAGVLEQYSQPGGSDSVSRFSFTGNQK